MQSSYSLGEIKMKVSAGLDLFSRRDSILLELNVNERSIAHKLAEYLQNEFSDWNVDCEYNRKGSIAKELDGIRYCDEQKRTDRIYPDIIVHIRNTEKNLLVIEVKVDSTDPCDIKKLQLFTNPRGSYRYCSGLFIQFKSDKSKPLLTWFPEHFAD